MTAAARTRSAAAASVLLLLALLLTGCGPGHQPKAAATAKPYAPVLCSLNGQSGSKLTDQGDQEAASGRWDLATQLYTAALAEPDTDPAARGCAAQGLGYIAVHRPSATVTIATDTASSWDTFYANWVSPTVRFGTAVLIVFVVLLVLAQLMTGVVVQPGTPGRSSRGKKIWVRLMSWLGVAGLAWAAAELTVAVPLALRSPLVRDQGWMQVVSLIAIPVLGTVLAALIALVGRAPDRARVVIVFGTAAVLSVACTWAYVSLDHWRDWRTAAVLGALLALLGGWVVARIRGTGLGLLVQGHDLTGAEDAGLADFVRVRLQALGSRPPRGIEVTQQTDVDSLPSDALGLIPAGVLAKAAALIVSLATPRKPWRIQITEQIGNSLSVVILRNGAVFESAVVSATMMELPELPKTETDPWARELRTAAAAFVLVQLTRRHRHLGAGLSGADQWRSVAAQVIATDQASPLSTPDRVTLLARAVGWDGKNLAAEVALLNYGYRDGASRAETEDYARALERLGAKDELNNPDVAALRIRLLFNTVVAWLNYALMRAPRSDDGTLLPDDHSTRLDALTNAEKSRGALAAALGAAGPGLGDLVSEIRAASQYFEHSIQQLRREAGVTKLPDLPALVELPPGSMVGRYQRACWRVQQHQWKDALTDLELVCNVPASRTWARQDPWMTPLHTLTDEHGALARRFKRAVGDPLPADFFGLAPFIAYRDALQQLGIHSAEQLTNDPLGVLTTELGISSGVAARWRSLARLHGRLVAINPNRKDNDEWTIGALFLLLLVDIDTSALLEARITKSTAGLTAALFEASRGHAIVAPTAAELIPRGGP